jgi:hypothetical protein
VINWEDRMDFMKRVKVTGGSKLLLLKDGGEHELENTQRYYASTSGGGFLVKVMPPLKGKTDYRRIGIDVGQMVTPCNDMNDAVNPIDYNHYIKEIENCLSLL